MIRANTRGVKIPPAGLAGLFAGLVVGLTFGFLIGGRSGPARRPLPLAPILSPAPALPSAVGTTVRPALDIGT